VLGLLGLALVSVAIAVGASLANPIGGGGDRATQPYPSWWGEMEEGRTTKTDLRRFAGRAPTGVEPGLRPGEECWYYELLAPDANYRFCFEGEMLSYKAHY